MNYIPLPDVVCVKSVKFKNYIALERKLHFPCFNCRRYNLTNDAFRAHEILTAHAYS